MLLNVKNLKTHFTLPEGAVARAVEGVDFAVDAGETVALVGESGSGKSVTAFSVMQLLAENAYHPAGEVVFEGRDILALPESKKRKMRGKELAMIFQEPMTSLNPLMRIDKQIMEPLLIHQGLVKNKAQDKVLELLKLVGIPDAESRMRNFPHQLSGGMRQRVMIAMALACRPKLLIADEPTTALDVTIQAQILGLIRELQEETNMGVIFITHDLGVVNQVADKVCVMYAGRFMETGRREEIFENMAHPYTRGLFASLPTEQQRNFKLRAIPGTVPSATDYPAGCPFHPRCREKISICRHEESPLYPVQGSDQCVSCHLLSPEADHTRDEEAWKPQEKVARDEVEKGQGQLINVENLKTHFPLKRGLFLRTVGHVKAVDDVTLNLPRGATVALVGESGCGKSTVGFSILRLLSEAEGKVVVDSQNALTWDKKQLRQMRKRFQVVFQDPFSSLSPRMTVEEIVEEGLRVHYPQMKRDERKEKVASALQEVGLDPSQARRYPHEFSGGQRQRISIARVLILQPDFLVLDEPTSALDVSVQAQILNLLLDLQKRHSWTYLFITHDLAVVEYMADYVAVMYLGKIVEYAGTQELFRSPLHPYTRSLLNAIPRPDQRKQMARLEGEIPSPITPPSGCHFHPRCPTLKQASSTSELA
ncbi:MAG: ABC transporter ATP-binding protein, partial [Verrucomicrobiota bacterium]